MAKPVTPTFYHRLFRVQPGHASRVLYPRERCTIPSLLEWIGFIPLLVGIVGGLFALLRDPLWAWWLTAIPIGIGLTIAAIRFEDRERFARARLRRRECFSCGAKLAGSDSLHCLFPVQHYQ
jgi:hypothetical protein